MKRGLVLDETILKNLEFKQHQIPTCELALKTKISERRTINHYLRLQMANKLVGYKIENLNVWCKKK